MLPPRRAALVDPTAASEAIAPLSAAPRRKRRRRVLCPANARVSESNCRPSIVPTSQLTPTARSCARRSNPTVERRFRQRRPGRYVRTERTSSPIAIRSCKQTIGDAGKLSIAFMRKIPMKELVYTNVADCWGVWGIRAAESMAPTLLFPHCEVRESCALAIILCNEGLCYSRFA